MKIYSTKYNYELIFRLGIIMGNVLINEYFRDVWNKWDNLKVGN